MSDQAAFILEAAESQAPVLFLVDGRVWEGHIQSCLDGLVVAVARPAGQSLPSAEQRWRLEEIVQMGPAESSGDDGEDEDELFTQARLMAEQARDYGEMSLAERLLKERDRRRSHGRG